MFALTINQILNIFIVLILTIILFRDYFILKYKLYRASLKIPGPPALPIIGNLLDVLKSKTDMLTTFINIVEKYDGVVRVWFGASLYIFVTKPEYMNTILASGKATRRGDIYENMKDIFGNSFITGRGQQRIAQRKAVVSELQFKTLYKNHLKNILNVCNVFLEKLQPLAKKGDTFDLANPLGLCTLDVACEVILGIKNFNQSEDMLPVAIAFREGFGKNVQKTATSIYGNRIISFFKNNYDDYQKYIDTLDQFCEKVLNEKKYLEHENKPTIIIDKLLKVTDSDQYNRIKSVNAITLIAQDTVTFAVGFLLTVLSFHQNHQRKLQEEIDEFVTKRDGKMDLTPDVFDKLFHLDLCLKEIIRLFPAAPALVRKLDADIKLDDKITLPAGCTISLLLQGMHVSPKIWDRPKEYRPERFMPEECLKRPVDSFLPHGKDQLSCIGKPYTNIVVKSIVIAILENFNVESDYKCLADIPLDIIKKRQPKNGFPLRLIPRNETLTFYNL